MREVVTSSCDASMCLSRRGVLLLCGLAGALSLTGCGGAAPAPKPTAEEIAQSALASGPTKLVPPPVEPPGPDLSGVEPEDVFVPAEAPTANFEITASAGKPVDGDVVLASAPSDAFAPTLVADGVAAAAAEKSPLKIPTGFTAVGPLHSSGLPTRLRCEADGQELVLVPAGSGALGSSDGPTDTQPYIVLELDAFYVGVTEVTVAQVKATRLKFPKGGIGEAINANVDPNQPAVGLPWVEARAYAKAIACDLPTEAQWEKAARGELGYPYPWGKSRPLWTAPRTTEQLDSVGAFPDDQSQFGAFDLAGNAREWTLDFYHPEAFKTLLPLSPDRRRNWAGPKSTPEGLRVVKGNGPDWKVWARRGVKMSERDPHIGFRCVLNLSSK